MPSTPPPSPLASEAESTTSTARCRHHPYQRSGTGRINRGGRQRALGYWHPVINCNRSNRLDSLCINLELLCLCLFLGQVLYSESMNIIWIELLLNMRDCSQLLLLIFYFGWISLFLIIDANCNCLFDLMKITKTPSNCHLFIHDDEERVLAV